MCLGFDRREDLVRTETQLIEDDDNVLCWRERLLVLVVVAECVLFFRTDLIP